MADSYRPPDRDRPRPLADRMTFTGGARSGDQHDFTFQSSHAAPHFPPSGPANARGGAPARRRDRGRGGAAPGGSSRPDGRNNATSYRGRGRGRGGFKKAAPYERALLQHRDDDAEQAMGVEEGSNRFRDPDDMTDDEEADMEVQNDGSDHGDGESDVREGNAKAARTQVVKRAGGDSVPKWSNPDPYTALPPPDETTGKKTDFVKLIRKAKNQEAEKVAAHNSVAANDDFISFGDEDDAGEVAHGSMNDLTHINDIVNNQQQAVADHRAGRPAKPYKADGKRKATVGGVVQEWLPLPNVDPTPWLPGNSADPYAHLTSDPEKW
jgi:non-canonical poly(A) RNA polymerase PAPD5/7